MAKVTPIVEDACFSDSIGTFLVRETPLADDEEAEEESKTFSIRNC